MPFTNTGLPSDGNTLIVVINCRQQLKFDENGAIRYDFEAII